MNIVGPAVRANHAAPRAFLRLSIVLLTLITAAVHDAGGQVYLDLKNPKAAEDQFEAALLLQSDSVEAQIGLAKAEIASGNFADAAQTLEALSKTHAKNAQVFSLLATTYTGMGKSAEAKQANAKAQLLGQKK